MNGYIHNQILYVWGNGMYTHNCFWFYVEKELSDVIEDIKEILRLPECHRDYEDRWEWYELEDTVDSEQMISFNMSREHDWTQGLYECPVILRIEYPGYDIDEIGRRLLEVFQVSIQFGKLEFSDYSPDYTYDIVHKWYI